MSLKIAARAATNAGFLRFQQKQQALEKKMSDQKMQKPQTQSSAAAKPAQGNGTPQTPTAPTTAVKERKKRAPSPWTRENPEPKDQKFRRLAKHRLGRAKKLIYSLVPLAKGEQYESTEQQRADIVSRLNEYVNAVKIAMERQAAMQANDLDW
jgi:hypothetical protein